MQQLTAQVWFARAASFIYAAADPCLICQGCYIRLAGAALAQLRVKLQQPRHTLAAAQREKEAQAPPDASNAPPA